MNATVRDRHGFTLVDVLICIVLVAIVLVLAFPAIRRAVATGKSVKCMATLHRLGVGISQYSGEHNGRLPPYSVSSYPYKQLAFVEMVKTYVADVPSVVECPANSAPVPRSSFDLGWMRYAYFGGIDPDFSPISKSTYTQWVAAGLVPNPKALRITDSVEAIVMSDQTTDPEFMGTKADTNHLIGEKEILGGNRLYLDGHMKFVKPGEAEIYTAAGRKLYR